MEGGRQAADDLGEALGGGGEVEARVTGQPRVVVVSGRQPDPAAFERDRGRVVVAVGAQVEPGAGTSPPAVASGPRAGARRAVRASSVRSRSSRFTSAASHASPCVVGRDRGDHAERSTRSRCGPSARRPAAPSWRRSPVTIWAQRRPGGVERLGGGDDRDRVVGGALEAEVGHVLGARQHQRRVDLVADHPGAVARPPRPGCPRARRACRRGRTGCAAGSAAVCAPPRRRAGRGGRGRPRARSRVRRRPAGRSAPAR